MAYDVKDDVAEALIGGMSVSLPIRSGMIELQVAMARNPVDLHHGVAEVGAGRAVPLAELYDANRSSIVHCEVTAQCSGEP